MLTGFKRQRSGRRYEVKAFQAEEGWEENSPKARCEGAWLSCGISAAWGAWEDTATCPHHCLLGFNTPFRGALNSAGDPELRNLSPSSQGVSHLINLVRTAVTTDWLVYFSSVWVRSHSSVVWTISFPQSFLNTYIPRAPHKCVFLYCLCF